MRRRPELMQLEMGISTRRYLPANGTAGLARSLVNGNRRVPCPPPMITESTLLGLAVWRLVCNIAKPFFVLDLTATYSPSDGNRASRIIAAQVQPGGAGCEGTLHLTGSCSRREDCAKTRSQRLISSCANGLLLKSSASAN